MEKLKKMNLNELRKLSRTEMKSIMAGSGSPSSSGQCRHLGDPCGGTGNTFCCDGWWCIGGTCKTM